MKYTIELTEKQAKILSRSCEQMCRLICGQDNAFRDLFEMAIWKRRNELTEEERKDLGHDAEELSVEIKRKFWNLPNNAYHGINYDDISDVLWDIYTVLRHQLWKDNPDPNKSKWTVDAFPPLQVGSEPLITINAKR